LNGLENRSTGAIFTKNNKQLQVKKIFLFLLFILSNISFPQLLSGQQFNFQNYSVSEGLAQSQVYAMIEDRQGYIWLGTQGGGVCRFDGKNFKQYSIRDGLVNNYVESLFEDQEGNIWVGTQKGFSKFDGLAFQNFHLPESDFITAISQEPLGKIWIGTAQGTYQFDGEKFTDYHLPSSRVNYFFYDNKDNLWIGTDESGAYQIRDEQVLKNFKIADGLSANNIKSIYQDDQNNIYFAIFNGGINVYNGSYFSYFRTNEGLASDLVTTMFADDEGQIWIGSQGKGVTIWNPKENTFSYLNESDGLANNHIRNILKDHWGNYWMGTSGGGVSKYSGQQFIHYNTSNGLQGNQVYALAKDTSGHFWLSASTKGISYFDGKKFTHFGEDEGFAEVKSKAIFVDDASRVWIGTEGNGLALFAKDTFQFFTHDDGLSGNFIRDIVQDNQGRIWIATAADGITQIEISREEFSLSPPLTGNVDSSFQASLIRYRDNLKFRIYRKGKLGLASRKITDLHVDKKGRIWFATRDNGIGFFKDDNTIFTISNKDGLLDNHVRSLTEDADGNLWIGMASKGICKLKMYRNSFIIENYNTFSYLDDRQNRRTITSNNVYLLQVDKDQNLWIGTEVGLDKLYFDKTGNINKIKHFGKSEGFLGIENCQNATLRDSMANLWFGTMNGLTKYNPASTSNNPIPPIVNITAVNLNYEPLSQTDFKKWANPRGGILPGLELPYDKNDLEFEFQGINLSNPEKVLYQWKLTGVSDDWTPLRPKNNADFNNLPPNNYTFFLRAFNEDGVANKTPFEMSFTILPPYWQTWWFRLVSVLLGVFLIAYFIRFRINQIREKAAREKEKLEMEKNLLTLEQKALQLQMNPHFIFNALNSIQSLISQKDEKKARYQLAKFSKLMRSILENSRSQVITLEDEIQTLQDYLAIEKSSRGNTFDFKVTTLLEVDTEELMIPPMMLQPFVENAIIHGVAHLTENGNIDIHFLQKNKILECSIQDNGIGRAAAKEIKSQIEHQHKSAALEVTQERLDILNKDMRGLKSLEITDLKNEDGTACGTKVLVRLPVEE
jgi:ligand-binding sensor domain-containing protein